MANNTGSSTTFVPVSSGNPYVYYVKRSCGLSLIARTKTELRNAMREFGTSGVRFTGRGYVQIHDLTWGRIHVVPEAEREAVA